MMVQGGEYASEDTFARLAAVRFFDVIDDGFVLDYMAVGIDDGQAHGFPS